MAERLTMQRLADELGVSRLTVSSVVNGHASERGISRATVDRVAAHLADRGYARSKRALDLRAGATGAVGLLHTGRLYSHLTEAFNLLVDSITDSPERLEVLVVTPEEIVGGIHELLARGVERLVWIQTRPPDDLAWDQGVERYLRRVRAVIYNHQFDAGGPDDELAADGVSLVGIDRAAGCAKLAHLLKRLGHTTVAIPDRRPGDEAPGHIEAALCEAGLRTVRTLPKRGKTSTPSERGRTAAAGILDAIASSRVTAACFNDDEEAGHAMAHLVAAGVRIPDDLSVTGFDGLEIASAFVVPLTSVRIPVPAMVKRVKTLLKRPGRKALHSFEPDLVLGKSHGRAKK